MKTKLTNFSLQDFFRDQSKPENLEFILPALKEFIKSKLSVSTVSKMLKNIKSVEAAIQDYDKIRITIIESICEIKDGKPIVENGQYKFSKEGFQEFNQKLMELLNSEIEIDIYPISESEITTDINGTCFVTLSKAGFIREKELDVKSNGVADKKELVA